MMLIFVFIELIIDVLHKEADVNFYCNDGKAIVYTKVCDGLKDCWDGLDETAQLCKILECQAGDFKCKYGTCLAGKLVCNGHPDCIDGSDENECSVRGIPKDREPSTGQSSTAITSTKKPDNRVKSSSCFGGNNNCNKNITSTTEKSSRKNRFMTNIQTILDYLSKKENITSPSPELLKLVDVAPVGTELWNSTMIDVKQTPTMLEPITNKTIQNTTGLQNSDPRASSSEGVITASVHSHLHSASFTRDHPTVVASSDGECRLPEAPLHGEYSSPICEVAIGQSSLVARPGCSNTAGTLVPNNWVLEYRCDAPYNLSSSKSKFSFCDNGVWKNPLDCGKLCPPLKSLSVDVQCFYGRREVSCEKEMQPDTTATARCKPHFKEVTKSSVSSLLCQASGEWSHKLFFCTPECGISRQNVPPGEGEFPWVAAIYIRNDTGHWNLMCTGTLIMSHLVLAAAHCFRYNDHQVLPIEVKVGLGKYSRNFNSNSIYSQIMGVREIVIPRSYSGLATHYVLDIALLDLSLSVKISPHIMPACFDWTSSFVIKNGSIGYLESWEGGKYEGENDTVQSFQLIYKDFNSCKKKVRSRYRHYLTFDKICGHFMGDQTNNILGGGLTFPKNGQHFLFGVSSVKFDDRFLLTFTNVTNRENHIWLEEQRIRLEKLRVGLATVPLGQRCPSGSFHCGDGTCLFESVKCDGHRNCTDGSDELDCYTFTSPPDIKIPPGSCVLPQYPKNGRYSSECKDSDPGDCPNNPGMVVDEFWRIKYSCDETYNVTNEKGIAYCLDGGWHIKIDCIRLCPPLTSLSVDVRCEYSGQQVSCDKEMRPNTVVTATCKEHYHLPPRVFPPESFTLTCMDDGDWNYKLFYCVPDCGVSTKPGSTEPQVLYGEETGQGEFPWLTALYVKNTSMKWVQICGGTLITPHIVLTAAHCLIMESSKNFNVSGKVAPKDIKVGLGKLHRDYYTQENNSVIANVRAVETPAHYSGASGRWVLDIGLLDLVRSVRINAFIMPACVDWNSKNFIFSPGMSGFVAGWGRTESGSPSETILSTQLIFVNNSDCRKRCRSNPSITHDTFCTHSINGSQVDRGDSGGGLTLLGPNDLHFIVGVVSVKVHLCPAFSLFTDIRNIEHQNWIEHFRIAWRKLHFSEI